MATTTTNFGWDIPQSTDLVKDGATAIAALGQDIDTAFIDLKGGTTGQVLAKASGTDLDFSWVAQDDSNAIQNAIVDAKGDLIAATAADTPARLAVGTNGQILTADSSAATGIKWADPAGGGGKILQVIYASTTTTTTITTTTFTDITNLTASITPSASTSRILILADIAAEAYRDGNYAGTGIRLLRGSTVIYDPSSSDNRAPIWCYSSNLSSIGGRHLVPMNYVDSPATTSATTYKFQGMCTHPASNGYASFNQSNGISNIILMEIGA